MSVLLKCENLTKKYQSFTALSDVNLTLERGKIIGLLGPNGSGKTTLIKLMNGLLVPSSGKILINDMEPGIESKKVVSYLPDKNYLNQWMKVKDLVGLFSDFYKDFEENKAFEMLSRLQINPEQRLKTLSKGTKEKVQLILVMSRKAELYCLDEPIGGVDPASREYILNTIINNYSENATVLISTHLIADIENVLDDFIFLQNGRVTFASSVEAVRINQGKSVDKLFREVFRC